jgi:hypothetical protein
VGRGSLGLDPTSRRGGSCEGRSTRQTWFIDFSIPICTFGRRS